MKKLILVTGFLLIGLNAVASDQMSDEIVCNKAHETGSADNDLTVILKSNATSWVKQVQIIENGYFGPRVIGIVQVPLLPKLITSSIGYIPEVVMVYKGKAATLSIRALNIHHNPLLLQGTGSINLRLPGYEPKTVTLNCRYAD
jgi:hypothetical protein